MRNALKWSAFVLLCVALAAFSAFAQSTGGSLSGNVTDEKGEPVIGATIQITGPALPGFQGAATDINGDYRIPYLPVGNNYQVKVEAQGFATQIRQGISIPLGVTVNLPFKMSGGTTTVTVVGAAPIIDSRKTEAGAVLSDQVINDIPLSRSSLGVAYLAPGVVDAGDNYGQGVGPAIGGASGLENSVTVNGIEMTGSGNAQNISSLNFDFIEAVEVKTGGLDAEFGGLMGGQVNSVTKSGGNEFHGGLFAYYTSDALEARSRNLDNPNASTFDSGFSSYDIGGSIGGYIIKDKLWFFASYDYNKSKSTIDNYNYVSPIITFNGVNIGSWANGRSLDSSSQNPMYALKLTWMLNENHQLSTSFFGNRSRNSSNSYLLRSFDPAISSGHGSTNSYALSFQWNATWNSKFFTEAVLGTRRSWINEGLPNDIRGYTTDRIRGAGSFYFLPYDQVTGDPFIWTRGGYNPLVGRSWDFAFPDGTVVTPTYGWGYLETEKDYNDQFRVRATNLFNFKGKHELSYGLQYFNIDYDRYSTYSGPSHIETNPMSPHYGHQSRSGYYTQWYTSRNLSAYLPGNPWDINGNGLRDDYLYYVARSRFDPNDTKETTQKYLALWIQDNWNITDYLMLKLGVRYDKADYSGAGNQQTLTPVVTGMQHFTDAWGYEYDFPLYDVGSISAAPKRKLKVDNQWAPRLGFTWDPWHNGKGKVYGFYGWYYERIPQDIAVRALSNEWSSNSMYADPAFTIPIDTVANWEGFSGWWNNPTPVGTYQPTVVTGGPQGGDLKGPYNVETLIGMQYELMPNFSMGVRAIFRDLGRTVEDISLDGAGTYIVTNPDKWTDIWVYELGGAYRFPKPTRRYMALEITADKRFSNNWFMGGSYVLSRLEGNYDGLFSPRNQQVDANITSTYDMPSLLLNSFGLLSNDRTHVLKAYGAYKFNWGLILSLSGVFQSGTPLNKYGTHPLYGAGELFFTPRGSEGRLPGVWELDMGLQYDIKLSKTTLGLRMDVFNLTNNQRTTSKDEIYNFLTTDPNPATADEGLNPTYGRETSHQGPRSVRFSVRWAF